MASVVKQRNNLIVGTLKNAFYSVYLALKTLSSTEELDEENELNEELKEIRKQENKKEIDNLEYMLEDNKSSKSKKTILKNTIKIQNPKKENEINLQRDTEKEIGE